MDSPESIHAPIGLIGGTGEEGRGIVLRLAQAGVPVLIGSRSAERARNLAAELNTLLGCRLIEGGANETLLTHCDILFLTVPFAHAPTVVDSMADRLRAGQTLVDVTVPLYFEKGPRLLQLPEGSGSQHLRSRLPSEVAMVATFKTLPAHLLANLGEPLNCDEFVVADSQEARDHVMAILTRIPSVRWINAGPLRYAYALEGMTLLAASLNRRFKSKEGRYRFLGIE